MTGTHPALGLLDVPHAVPADSSDPLGSPDAGVAAHFGDPYGEQRAAVETVALVDRSNRDVLALRGPDRLRLLHDLTSQSLAGLEPGHATETLLLGPTGHIENHAVVTHTADVTWLDTEPGAGPALADFLVRMRFRSDVDVRDESAAAGVLTLLGPESVAALRAVGLPQPVPDEVAAAGELLVRGIAEPGVGGVELLGPLDALRDTAVRLLAAGVRPAGAWAYDALRIAAWRPRFGVDTDERAIPNELRWLRRAVHLDKGCYRGQETVARVHNLGRPPRRLALLQLDGGDSHLPARGAALCVNDAGAPGRQVGFVTSAARHYELGPIALALVKSAIPDETPLLVAGPPGEPPVAARIDRSGEPPEPAPLGRRPAPELRGRPRRSLG